jgi:spore maturation protein CgeB
MRAWRLLVVHPGAPWATADVFDGLCVGLQEAGVEVVPYRLDHRIAAEQQRGGSTADVLRRAGSPVCDLTRRSEADAVVIVSGTVLHPDVLADLRACQIPLFALFTESPYDQQQERQFAATLDGCWTHERTAVEAFRSVCPHAWYLPHGWHPRRHMPDAILTEPQIAAHDVVFVGSGFPERVTWFNAIDWTGINLGLYGIWGDMGLKPALEGAVHASPIRNTYAAALYRRARIGLNLYRWPRGMSTTGESLNPRAYELAACGTFTVSAARAETAEVFGSLVPTFTAPREAEALIRQWLKDAAGRTAIAAQLPACVAESSWTQRATRLIGDLQAAGLSPKMARRTASDIGDRESADAPALLLPFQSSPAWIGAHA